MPILDSSYTDADMITALYSDPTNSVLLAEYALQTGAVQLGLQSANLGASNPLPEDPAGGGGEPPCFTGETRFTLFNGDQLDFAALYRDRAKYIGLGAAAFTTDNILVPGEIRDVYKSTIFAILNIWFEGEKQPMRMAKNHRFWIKNRVYKPMSEIRRNQWLWTYNDGWKLTRVVDRKLEWHKEGIDVYNAKIGIYGNYFAAQPDGAMKAVSNTKKDPNQTPGGPS